MAGTITQLHGVSYLSQEIKDAKGDEAAWAVTLERVRRVTRAQRVYIVRLLDGASELTITHATTTEEPPAGERAEVIEVSWAAIERHAKKYPFPDDQGSNDAAIPDTDESIPLTIVGKVVADREYVRAVIVIVRLLPKKAGVPSGPFDPVERRFLTLLSGQASIGFHARHRIRTAPAQTLAPGERRPKTLRFHPGEAKRLSETEKLSGTPLDDLRGRMKEIVGASDSHAETLQAVERVADLDCTVAIEGESGVGKDVVARAIHAQSKRKDGVLACANLAAIPESLLEAELFGYAKGAFTGALADRKGLVEEAQGGTLFLDEIGELPLHVQVKLLRVIEAKQVTPLGTNKPIDVDFRLITATNRKLKDMVKDKTFREDLYYRLAVATIYIPPLRDRRADVAPLVHHFLHELTGGKSPALAQEAWTLIETHAWPGNVRELKHAIERALTFKRDPIRAKDFQIEVVTAQSLAKPVEAAVAFAEPALEGDESEAQRYARFRAVFDANEGNVSRTARILGVNRCTVARVLRLWRPRTS